MNTLFIYALEVIICSGVFMSLYMLLLERKVGFLFCRFFLLASVIISAVIPLLNIPVWAPEAAVHSVGISVGELSVEGVFSSEAEGFNYGKFIVWFYIAGVAVCVVNLLLQWLHISRIARRGVSQSVDSVKIVRTSENIASFSLFNTIFVSEAISAEDLQVIIAHERSHIAHRHSWERLAMELFKAAMWWNPFVWVISRRLTEVEEFEADNDVISSGHDAKIYVTTLLKHLFGYSPEIANGLHKSLTKKRLKMILKNGSGRYALLRKVAIIPVLGCLLALFSFTTREVVANDAVQSVAAPTTFNSYVEFHQWVMMNVIYPEEARAQNLTGSVVASLTVGTDGKVKDVKIVKSSHDLFADEARRVLAKVPDWRPFVKDGKAVEVKYMLPIHFTLGEDNGETVGGVVVKSFK